LALKIYQSLEAFIPSGKTVVTLGTFDGVHKGHNILLLQLHQAAQSSGCQSVVLTFFPHPRMVLQQSSEVKLLNTMDEKAALLDANGIDNLIIHPFSVAFSHLTAEDFVKDILVGRLNISKMIIGHDHRFGRNRTATTADLVTMGQQYGFEVVKLSALEVNDTPVSSTKIRNSLIAGDITLANNYLGYPYFITGIVGKGKQLGRTIGFPTANITVPETYKLIPAHGVYAVSAIIDGKIVFGMMNIGTRPTVDGAYETIEVNFLDFEADIYDTELKISLHHRLRSEQKFDGLDALKAQLRNDREATADYFKSHRV
jgi:riboflavin kinase / FMN adenylyltransferase